jgi:hypothetical protein
MEIAAYYYPATKAQKAKGRSGAFELHQLHNGARTIIGANGAILCDSVKEARQLAKGFNAKPWNF